MRIGIIGTGRIAERFVKTALVNQPDAQIVCVYNPRIASAKRFADAHGIENCTDDLATFAGLIDVVYVASPHETHYEYAKEMLMLGKHVLCEKPMALKECQAVELYELASPKGLVLMEAIKTAYCPGFVELLKVAKSGVIGEIRDVEAAFTRLTPKDTREYQNVEFGGSLLEFGSYVLMPVVKLLGCDFKAVEFKSIMADTGVDDYTKVFIGYDKGMATGKVGLGVKSEGQLLISGTQGYILAPSPWWMTKKFEVRFEDPNKREEYTFPYESSGLQYEVDEFINRINGKSDGASGVMPEESVAIAKVFERFRM